MARRKLEFGIINITMHPHSPLHYVELLTAAWKTKCLASLGRRQLAVITNVTKYNPADKDDDAAIQGEFVKFTDIDLDGDWFNVNDMKLAEDTDLASINILEHLKPNTERFYFVFYPKKHLLFYEAYSKGHKLTPASAQKALELILNNKILSDKYGKIEVIHIPQTDALETALKTKVIRQLTLKINRPNADHFDVEEVNFLRKMQGRNVAQVEETLTAIKGTSIDVDHELKLKAQIAAKNGLVKLEGKDSAHRAVSFSTLSHPRIETAYYDSKSDTALSFLYKMASQLLDKIK